MKPWTLSLTALVAALSATLVGAGIAWHRGPETEWYDLFDCPSCGEHTLLEGLVVRRYIILLVIPIPLWRDWVVRCSSCATSVKIDKDEWRRRASGAFSKKEVLYAQAGNELKQRNVDRGS